MCRRTWIGGLISSVSTLMSLCSLLMLSLHWCRQWVLLASFVAWTLLTAIMSTITSLISQWVCRMFFYSLQSCVYCLLTGEEFFSSSGGTSVKAKHLYIEQPLGRVSNGARDCGWGDWLCLFAVVLAAACLMPCTCTNSVGVLYRCDSNTSTALCHFSQLSWVSWARKKLLNEYSLCRHVRHSTSVTLLTGRQAEGRVTDGRVASTSLPTLSASLR